MGRTPTWNITLNSIMYMAVPLSMPATMAAAGWLWGAVWFTYCSVATYWTGLIIGRVFDAHPTLTTYPVMAAEGFAQLCMARTGGNLARAHGWRVFGRRLVLVMQFVTYYLDTVTQMIYVAQFFGQLLPGAKVCQWTWLVVVWGISVPLMQIPTFHASRRGWPAGCPQTKVNRPGTRHPHPVHPITRHPVHPITRHPVHPITRHPVHPITLHPVHPITLHPVHPITLHPMRPITLHPVRPITLHPVHPITLHPVHIPDPQLHPPLWALNLP